MLPGISVATRSRSASSGAFRAQFLNQEFDSDEEQSADGDLDQRKCPVYLFRAQSFCAAQQFMINCLKMKVERFRSKVEREKANLDNTRELPSWAGFFSYKEKYHTFVR